MLKEPVVIQVSGSSIYNCLAAVRQHLKIPLKDNREVLRSGGEDSLWRVHLESGVIAECTVIYHARAEVHG